MDNFTLDIEAGLSAKKKYLPSMYFYDHNGDKIFQSIMNLDEYYLTRCEYEILENNKGALLEIFRNGGNTFNLVELGAGDGYKTKILLKYFLDSGADFHYMPIDISENAINILRESLEKELPALDFKGVASEYFNFLESFNKEIFLRKAILLLGSNIGNFKYDETVEFLRHIGENMHEEDFLLIGFDLMKEPGVILKAYNDKGGVTAAFNLNLLERINRELGGNFDKMKFEHFPIYNPETGECKSYLISLEKQVVRIEKLGKDFYFDEWEPVFMEVSQKYNLNMIEQIADESGFRILKKFFDKKRYFLDTAWVLK